MDCRKFKELMPRFLEGELTEPLFGEMVEHEAVCPLCHEFASGAVVEPGLFQPTAGVEKTQLESILGRTAGDDCHYVQIRMAEALEEELPAGIAQRVGEHVGQCPACQRMRDLFHELPVYYDSLPVLTADRSFTMGVLERTIGSPPGFWDVLRALWRRPEVVWEAAAVCALVAVLLFGGMVPSYDEVTQKAQGVAELAGMQSVGRLLDSQGRIAENRAFGPVVSGYDAVRTTWGRVRNWAGDASAWTQRLGTDIREGDLAALFNEIRVVLEPIGLYPDSNETETETETETTDDSNLEGEE